MQLSRFTRVLAILALFFVGCGEDVPDDTLSVDKNLITFDAAQSDQVFQVSANCNWSLSIPEGSEWLSASPRQGEGNGSVTLSARSNTGADRTGKIRIASSQKEVMVEVVQKQEEILYWDLSQVRALYKGSDVTISQKVIVRATVISNYMHTDSGGLNNYTSMKAIVVSDGKAGVQLYCAENNTAFMQGDKVEIDLTGQTLSVFSKGPIQVNGIPLANIKKTGETEALVAKAITAEQLLSGAFESMYVAVADVQVTDENLNKTFVMDAAHTSIEMISKNKESFDIFSSKYSSFKDMTVPSGSGVLKGIAGVYGSRYQISLAKLSDLDGLTGERFYSGPTFRLNTTEKEVSGDAGEFSVTLAANVDWTVTSSAPDAFAVSPSSGSGSAAVKVTYSQNPSQTAQRSANIVFTTKDASIEQKTLTLHVTQSPFEALVSDAVMPWLELPKVAQQEDFAYISHMTTVQGKSVRNYSFWYDTRYFLAHWVAYPLYQSIIGSGSRSDSWDYNPKVPKRYQPVLFYSFGGSTYDRGHQLPSADRLYSPALNATTFYFTNMTAQNATFNQNLWGNLETKVRNWAKECDTLYVVTGVMIQTADDKEVVTISDNVGNKVAIPKLHYKVLLRYNIGQSTNGGYSAIGFWYPNVAGEAETVVAADAKSVKEIETLTGLDFFHNLPDDVEAAVEASCSPKNWGFN